MEVDLQLVFRPQDRYRPFRMSDLQQAYFVGRSSDFSIGNVGSHAYHEYEIPGLELAQLQAAWCEVVARHDALRTVFSADLQQRVIEQADVPPIRCNDLRDLPAGQLQERLNESRSRLGAFVFDPLTWPLFALELSLLPDGETVLHLAIDLLVVDASSMGVIKHDLVQAYMRPGTLAAAPLTLTFRDYMVALDEYEHGAEYGDALAYWNGRIDSLPMPPELPYSVPRDPQWRPAFRRTLGTLSAERWALLKKRAADAGVTATVVLLAAYGSVLARFSANKRFLLNLTLNSRPPVHEEIGQVVGDFTSVVLLELDFSTSCNFDEQCRIIQEQLWVDLEHNAAGGLRVIREISRRQKSPFIVPIVFTSTLGADVGRGGAEQPAMRRRLRSGQTPQVLLDHLMNEEDGVLHFGWNVVEEVFPSGLQVAMWETYRSLLDAISSPQRGWDAPCALPLPDVQLRQRADVNATAAPCDPVTLDAMFLAQARRQPQAIAVYCEDGTLTYGELDGVSAALAERVLATEVRPGQLVGVLMSKGWEQVAAVLGILRAGAAYLPLDPELPLARLRHLAKHAGATMLLTQPAWHTVATELQVDAVVVQRGMASTSADAIGLCSGSPEALAYVLYTSGSTGVPKGVAIDHAGACNTILDINGRFDVTDRDRILALSSLSFDLSVYDIFGALAAGGALVMPSAVQQRDPVAWLALAERCGVTIWNSVPMLLKLFAQACIARGLRLPSLRLAMASGDWVPRDLFNACRQVSPVLRFISLGGATEASIWSIFREVDQVHPEWSSVPYGKPLTNQTMHVFDASFAPCPMWVTGEIFIGGIGLALGYWNDAERTQAAFVTHPLTGERLYRTGDLGRYLPDGDIEFLGRRDHQVKLRGFRVELGEIEAVLMQQPSVRQAAALVYGDALEARLIACVVAQPGMSADAAALRNALQLALPAYMVPAAVVILDKLPLTPNGKLDRSALAEQAAPAALEGRQYVAPAPGIEIELAGIWAELLQVERVGGNDNFFDLGGHSILATQMVARVRERYAVELPLRQLFEAPVLAAVASLVEQVRSAAPVVVELAQQDDGDMEMFSFSSEDDADFVA
ncbi:MAG: hypothetical protein NVSMB6_01360 [Burkholderiaceae bacterium]